MPVPLRATLLLDAAVPVTVSIPLAVPCADGLNATLSCILLEGANVAWPFQPDSTKAELLTVTDWIVTDRLLEFVRVMLCAELVVPTF